jgi:ubiquinone/menaquinone biosynthesis C-methylase UbiE
MAFQDHFSTFVEEYAAHRPTYPAALFDWLAEAAPSRARAWDCACGSGQATLGLARAFERVIATDASAQQIAAAPAVDNVTWRVAPAEASGLAAASVDCIAVAQAIHWFDLDAFYREARRVARPGAVLAAWSYDPLCVDDPEAARCVEEFYEPVLGPYWRPERQFLKRGYRTLPFPAGSEIEAPSFAIEARWNVAELTGYFRTWSAVRNFIARNGHDPVGAIEPRLREAFGDPARRVTVTMPLGMRVARL